MSRKRQKDALKFILGNSIILRKLGDALGCEKKMSDKELKVVVKDMIKTYAEETCTDSFTDEFAVRNDLCLLIVVTAPTKHE